MLIPLFTGLSRVLLLICREGGFGCLAGVVVDVMKLWKLCCLLRECPPLIMVDPFVDRGCVAFRA